MYLKHGRDCSMKVVRLRIRGVMYVYLIPAARNYGPISVRRNYTEFVLLTIKERRVVEVIPKLIGSQSRAGNENSEFRSESSNVLFKKI